MTKEISAGGVVFRFKGGNVELLLIEDRYQRITLPKGKQEVGERLEETALREIEEETGIRGDIIKPLARVNYTYHDPERGEIDKEVIYYLVKSVSGTERPQLEEINRLFWMDLEKAWPLLKEKGYPNNMEVFQQAYTYLVHLDKESIEMTRRSLASYIDHTLLRPEATENEIDQLCQEAKQYQFAAVCINPFWVKRAAQRLQSTPIKVCTVVGFPLGATTAASKVAEARQVVEDGAEEVDMVLNIGALKSGLRDEVYREIEGVVQAVKDRALVKVIIETALLSDAEKRLACQVIQEAGAHYVKTSTGFLGGGATVHDVRLLKEAVGERLKVKASGGIRNYETALAMIEAGASRLGTSASLAILKGQAGSR